MTGKRLREQLSSMSTDQLRARIEALGDQGDVLMRTRPRPIARPCGERGPTPEQALRHQIETSAWNRAWRQNRSEHKIGVEIDDERIRAGRDRARSSGDLERETAVLRTREVSP